jgi:DNA-binding LacI/PurR family transcriptional regulator
VNRKLSFQDLAKHAKVSAATVSRVARGQTTVAPAIRERVRKAAAELGIDLEERRHESATVIAFLLSNRDLLHSFQARILLGAQHYCSSQNRELLFLSFRYSPAVPAKDLHLPQILSQRSLVRAVILGGTNTPNLLEALRDQEIQFSVLGNNVIGEWNPAEYDAVYSDDVQGAYDLTTQLIADGHRDIWFIGDVDLPWYARCAEGYCSVREFPEELGRHLAEFALKGIEAPEREPQQLTIPTRVIVRESTRSIPGKGSVAMCPDSLVGPP